MVWVLLLLGIVAPMVNGLSADCSWTAKAPIPTARMGLSISAVNGKLYAVGGASSLTGTYYAAVEAYDPATDTWTSRADMPTARMNLVAIALDGKMYALGGGAWNSSIYATVEMYDPDTDTWIQGASMPVARHCFGASVVNGKIYAIGGTQEWYPGQGTSAVHEHDPTPNVSLTLQNSWLCLSWRGVLQSSSTLSNPDWTDITPAPRRCPWAMSPNQDAHTTFYRARAF